MHLRQDASNDTEAAAETRQGRARGVFLVDARVVLEPEEGRANIHWRVPESSPAVDKWMVALSLTKSSPASGTGSPWSPLRDED